MQRPAKPEWYQRVRAYSGSSFRTGLLQVVSTLFAYAGLWTAIILSVQHGLSLWVPAMVIVPTSFVLVRIFVLFHDCCHGSLFPGRKLNVVAGHITGVLAFTPYEAWRRSHLRHHATNAQLDHRGTGDVWTMTVREYRDSPPALRLRYRFFRSPFVMFLLGPIYIFFLKNRFLGCRSTRQTRRSTIITNLGLAAVFAGGAALAGFVPFLLLHLAAMYVAAVIGIWLFYVQHQFVPGYWAHDEDWTEVDAAIRGSSFYAIPSFFQWLFANIGIHHIHHLLPRIPNYRLSACYRDNPEVQVSTPLSLRDSLLSLNMKLWDESRKEYVSFRQLRLPDNAEETP